MTLALISLYEGGVTPGEHLEGNYAEGPDVHFCVVALEARFVDGGEAWRVLPHLEDLRGQIRVCATEGVESLRFGVQVTGQAEICDLDERLCVVFCHTFIQEDILTFYVPMNDVHFM